MRPGRGLRDVRDVVSVFWYSQTSRKWTSIVQCGMALEVLLSKAKGKVLWYEKKREITASETEVGRTEFRYVYRGEKDILSRRDKVSKETARWEERDQRWYSFCLSSQNGEFKRERGREDKFCHENITKNNNDSFQKSRGP